MFTYLSSFIISGALFMLHKMPFVGFLSVFFVFSLNRKHADGEAGFRSKMYWFLSLPFVVGVAALTVAPALSYYLFERIILPSYLDLGYFVVSSIVGIGSAIFMLRSGVQVHQKISNKLTKNTELERNKKTDVREIQKHLPQEALEFDPVKFMDSKKGVLLGLDEQKKPSYINFGGGTSAPHVQVVGTTGAGKGVSLGVMASQFLERGEAIFFCDPKNDEWAPSVMYDAAKRTGKPYHFINLNRPAGAQFNLFEGATADESFELFQAGFSLTEKGDASDFYGIADRKEALATARQMAADKLTIAQVFEARQEFTDQAEKFYGKLREMAETPSINATSGGVSLSEVISKGGCVYIVGSMRNDIVKTAQRILLVRLLQLAEKRDRMAGELRKICIVLDEVKYHLSRPALEGLGAARDKGVHLVLAHQSLGDLKDCTKDLNPDAVVDAVVENCRVKLCYRVQSPVTAEWLSKMSGKILVDDEQRTVEKNLALSETVENRRNIRQAERYFIDENMLLNLPPSVAVLYGAGLPKFVSIRPLRVAKSPDAVAIREVAGATLQTASDALDVPPAPPVLPVPRASARQPFPFAAPANEEKAASPFPSAAADAGDDDLPPLD